MKTIILYTILTANLFFVPFILRAQTKQYMVLKLTSGEKICILQTDIPKVSFVEGKMQICTEWYNLSGVSSYTIEQKDPTSIENMAYGNGKDIVITDDNLIIPTDIVKEGVRFYSTNGIELQMSGTISEEGRYRISLKNYPDNVIIVKSGNSTFKVKTK